MVFVPCRKPTSDARALHGYEQPAGTCCGVSLEQTAASCAVWLMHLRDGTRPDLDVLEKWDWIRLIKFNKAKFKVLHMGLGNPKYQPRL